MAELTREQKLAQLGNAEKEAERLSEMAARLRQDLGISSDGEVELSDAELWDKLTPKEKFDLYVNHRERWTELAEAKQTAGIKRLLERK